MEKKVKKAKIEEAKLKAIEAEGAAQLVQEAKREAMKTDQLKQDAETYRKERLAFLEKLPTKVMNGTAKPFVKAESFTVIQYLKTGDDEQVNLYKTFKANNYQDAFENFAEIIKSRVTKDNDDEFGLIGNSQLLFTTSVFIQNLTKKSYTFSGDEFMNDNVSQMMIGQGLKDKLLSWPEDSSLNETVYQMIFYNNETGKSEVKALGTNYAAAKKIFEKETSSGQVNGVLLDGFKWKL